MPRGGARNRSGPAPDENSGRSDRRSYSLQALPARGYDGPTPSFPLPPRAIYTDGYINEDRTEAFADRELDLWDWAWHTPQAWAWAQPSESWRIQTVARWVRQAAMCEQGSATAADHGQLHRYADQIGLTTAGLREMGWKVAVDEVAEKRASVDAEPAPRQRRLRAVSGDQ